MSARLLCNKDSLDEFLCPINWGKERARALKRINHKMYKYDALLNYRSGPSSSLPTAHSIVCKSVTLVKQLCTYSSSYQIGWCRKSRQKRCQTSNLPAQIHQMKAPEINVFTY